MLKFTLIGDGQVAKYHRKAIKYVGGEIVLVIDPKNGDEFPKNSFANPYKQEFGVTDYFVICSPSHCHRQQIQYLLSNLKSTWKEFQIVCEKPAFLPWEPIVCDSKINVVLQMIYEPALQLIKKASKVRVQFVRDESYFKTWKGDPKKTGGLFYNLFIHWIHLSHLLGCDFEGKVVTSGEQYRYIYDTEVSEPIFNLIGVDTQYLYNRLYEEVVAGNGIKIEQLFYLNWILARNSELFGYGKDAIGKVVKIGRELL